MINKNADLVFPASHYCADVMRASGVSSDKIRIFPYGVDTGIFKRDQKNLYIPKDKFNFLYCAIPHARKGIDVLFETFLRTFNGRDDVRLILKTGKKYDKKRKPVFVIDVMDTLAEARAKVGVGKLPEIMIIDGDFDSAQLATIYNSAHAYVAPSRSEGFGMTVLEAMACGVPVIATNYSAHTDFLNARNAYLIDVSEASAPASMQYWQYQKGAVIGEPNLEQLASHMLEVYNHGQDPQKVAAGMKTANDYTWDKSVKKLEKHMVQYLGASGTTTKRKPNGSSGVQTRSVGHTTVKTSQPSTPAVDKARLTRSDLRMKQLNVQPTNVVQKTTRSLPSKHKAPAHTTTSIRNEQRTRQTIVTNSASRHTTQQRETAKAPPVRPARSTNAAPSKLQVSTRHLIIFTNNSHDDLMGPVFNQAANRDMKITVYGPHRPEFLRGASDLFVQAKRSDFVKFLHRQVHGTTIVADEQSMRDSSFLSTAMSMMSKSMILCATTSKPFVEYHSKYNNIVFMYNPHDIDAREMFDGMPVVTYDTSGTDSIFDFQILPGGIMI